MLDVKKVKYMTKAAMIQQKQYRGTFTAGGFFASDFISFQLIKGIVSVTIGYVLIIALWALNNFEELVTAYSVGELWNKALMILAMYGVVLLVGAFTVLLINLGRYWKAKESLKDYRSSLRRISRIYEKEAKEGE